MTRKPWDRYKPGTKKWFDAHKDHNGAIQVTQRDYVLLHSNKKWVEEKEKAMKAIKQLSRKMSARSKAL